MQLRFVIKLIRQTRTQICWLHHVATHTTYSFGKRVIKGSCSGSSTALAMALLTALGMALAMALATALATDVAKDLALAPAQLLRWLWRQLL